MARHRGTGFSRGSRTVISKAEATRRYRLRHPDRAKASSRKSDHKRWNDPAVMEKRRLWAKDWRLKNKVRVTATWRKGVCRKNGISVEVYDGYSSLQNHKCAICERPNEDSRARRLAIDHDHKCCPGRYSCGQCVRGLLCDKCNVGLGWFRDNSGLLSKAAKYVERGDDKHDLMDL